MVMRLWVRKENLYFCYSSNDVGIFSAIKAINIKALQVLFKTFIALQKKTS